MGPFLGIHRVDLGLEEGGVGNVSSYVRTEPDSKASQTSTSKEVS